MKEREMGIRFVQDWDSTLNIQLRPYQKECLDLVQNSIERGNRKLLISIPTGGGKTLIFNTFSIAKDFRTLVIAHRDELLEQAVDKYLMLGGRKENVGVIRAGEWRENKYTVASIQTLYRNLDRVDGRNYDLVVIDESHHLCAPTYRAVYESLLKTNPNLLVLGVTATPFRSDKQDLSELFDDLAYAIDILELIRLGYLVPVRGRLVKLPVELDKLRVVKKENGEEDFSEKQMSRLLNTDEVNEKVVRGWFEYGENRKTIFYLSSLDHAKSLCEAFKRAGVPAGYVEGNMPMSERRKVLRDFKEGRIKVLTNMNILTEGFDDPEVECIGIVRPTKSLSLYAQIVGRGLRIAPGKKDCLILDYTGISKKRTIVGLSELFGLDLGRHLEEGEEVSIGAVDEEVVNEDGEVIRERKVKVLVGGGSEVFTFEGKEASLYATKIGEDIVVSCGKNGKNLLLKKNGKLYDLYLLFRGSSKLLRQGLTEDYAWTTLTTVWKSEMDDFMVEYRERAINEEPTERQMLYIRRAIATGVIKEEDLPQPLTKLHATNILGYIFSTTDRRFDADVVIKFSNGKMVDVISGLELRLFHVYILEHVLRKRIVYPNEALETAIKSKNLAVLEGTEFDDFESQIADFYYWLEKKAFVRIVIPQNWFEGMPEWHRQRVLRFFRDCKAKMFFDSDKGLLYVTEFPASWVGKALSIWFS